MLIRFNISKQAIHTNYYILEEHDLIKKWNVEVKRGKQQETKEYRWREQGTPRTGSLLIQMRNE